uniref:Prenylcysteine oxidase 1 n=1 Tax=Salmo trutta TaxID=8032 RepID=A0A673WYA6_SALTR
SWPHLSTRESLQASPLLSPPSTLGTSTRLSPPWSPASSTCPTWAPPPDCHHPGPWPPQRVLPGHLHQTVTTLVPGLLNVSYLGTSTRLSPPWSPASSTCPTWAPPPDCHHPGPRPPQRVLPGHLHQTVTTLVPGLLNVSYLVTSTRLSPPWSPASSTCPTWSPPPDCHHPGPRPPQRVLPGHLHQTVTTLVPGLLNVSYLGTSTRLSPPWSPASSTCPTWAPPPDCHHPGPRPPQRVLPGHLHQTVTTLVPGLLNVSYLGTSTRLSPPWSLASSTCPTWSPPPDCHHPGPRPPQRVLPGHLHQTVTTLVPGLLNVSYLGTSTRLSPPWSPASSTCPTWAPPPDCQHPGPRPPQRVLPGHLHQTVTTLVPGLLNVSYLDTSEKPSTFSVSDILTTDSIINSLSSIDPVHIPPGYSCPPVSESKVWKVFSPQPLSQEQLQDMFLSSKTKWLAYPAHSPPHGGTSPFILHERLYYLNTVEWAASTMEMSTISARNLALLAHHRGQDATRRTCTRLRREL